MGVQDDIRTLFQSKGQQVWWRDGVFCDQMWETAPKRVLFLLKEPNGSGTQYSSLVEQHEGLTHPLDWPGWVEIGRWAHAVISTTDRHFPNIDECDLSIHALNEPVAVPAWKVARHQAAIMNLKKEPGTSYVESYETLKKWAENHGAFLHEQFQLLNPQVIVFCGEQVREIASGLFKLPAPGTTKLPYFIHDGRLWIDFIHYKARYTTFASYYALAGMTRAALEKPGILALFS